MRHLVPLTAIALFLEVSFAHAQCAPPPAGAWGRYGIGPGQFATPFGVAIDSDGIVYITDEGNSRVQKFHSNGTYIGEWSTGADTNPTGIAISPTGVVYVVLHHVHLVAMYTTSGNPLGTFGTPGSTLYYPVGIALGSGRVYVASSQSARI